MKKEDKKTFKTKEKVDDEIIDKKEDISKAKPRKKYKISRRNINNKTEDIKTSVSFNLIEMILIILMTGIIVSIVSGVIVYDNFDRLNKVTSDNKKTITKSGLNKFEENYNKILNKYIEDVNKDELLEAAIKGMYDYLGDDYSMYIDKESNTSMEEQLQGEYTGIGIEISTGLTNEGYISIITKVFKGSPAEAAGFKVGDLLLELNGVDLKEKDSSYVANTIKYGNEENHILKVMRDKNELTITVSRKLVKIDYVTSEVFDGSIGYIKLDTFAAPSASQVKEALDKMDKSIKSLIIDLRDNSGGYLNSAYDISNIFVEKGKNIYQIKDRNNKITSYKADKDVYRKFDKIVVLVNESSASASEILALALKESAGAKIVGAKSFGKGTVQETDQLSSGAMVKYTTAYWLSPNGNSINKVGIEPDIVENDVEKQLEVAKKAVK